MTRTPPQPDDSTEDHQRGEKILTIRLLLLALLLFAVLPLPAQQEDPSTPTLRLGDLFDARPGEVAYTGGTNRYRAGGPLLFIPSTQLWKAPRPTPTPTPQPTPDLPDGFTLPKPPLLIQTLDRSVRDIDQPAYTPRGRLRTAGLEPDTAQMTTATDYLNVRAAYTLKPVQEPGMESWEPIRFYHGPETEETFSIPAGRYRVERRLWLANQPDKQVVERYEAQRFREGFAYTFRPALENERVLIQRHLR